MINMTIIAGMALLIIWFVARAYTLYRDPLHPLMFLGPLFFMSFVLDFGLKLNHPQIGNFFPDANQLTLALLVHASGLFFLFLGVLHIRGRRCGSKGAATSLDAGLEPAAKKRLLLLSYVLGLAAVLAYFKMLHNVGGFIKAYSHAKGGVLAYSGYVGEAINLAYPAVILLALARQGARLSAFDVFAALSFITPNLLQGTFGGRRGPLFISFSVLFFGYIVARSRIPRVRTIMATMAGIMALVIFVWSQRQQVYLGSKESVQTERFWEKIAPESLDPGDNVVVSMGIVLTTIEQKKFEWGRRFFITYFIRPIPKQIWPTKYRDMESLLYGGTANVLDDSDWEKTLGWAPLGGYAVNAIADTFLEFGWLYLIPCFLFGKFLGVLWRNFRQSGGYWSMFFLFSAILSVYLPTQSLSAFLVRFLYMSIPVVFVWKVYVRSRGRRPGQAADAAVASRGRLIIRKKVQPW